MLVVPKTRLLEHTAELKNKVVLITGSGGGFGLSTALLASQHGAKVIIADVKAQLVTDALTNLRAAGGTCSAPRDPVDVTDLKSLRNAFQHSQDEYGKYPDVVIANAGVSADDHFEEDGEVGPAESQETQLRPPRNLTLAVNLNGVLNTCVVARECWDSQPSDSNRRLVVLSSMGGMTGIPLASAYAASKHALMAYWQGTCQDLAQGKAQGFTFDVICPFFAKTAIFDPKTLLVLAGIPLIELDLVAQSMIYSITRPASIPGSTGYAIILADNGDPMLAPADEYDPLSPEWTRLTNEGRSQYNEWTKISAWRRVYRDVAKNYYKTSDLGLALRIVATIAAVYLAIKYASQLLQVVPAWVPIAAGTAFGLSGRLGDVRRKSDILRAKNKAAFKAKQRAAAQEALAKEQQAH